MQVECAGKPQSSHLHAGRGLADWPPDLSALPLAESVERFELIRSDSCILPEGPVHNPDLVNGKPAGLTLRLRPASSCSQPDTALHAAVRCATTPKTAQTCNFHPSRCMPYSVKPHQPFIMARLDLPEMLFDLFGTEVHKV